MKDYHINLFYSKEDKGYIADIPDLRSCSAFGDTPEEALHEVLIAKSAWLQACRDVGKPIPKPHYRPALPVETVAVKPMKTVRKNSRRTTVAA